MGNCGPGRKNSDLAQSFLYRRLISVQHKIVFHFLLKEHPSDFACIFGRLLYLTWKCEKEK
jgi:hypothetical protein